MEMYDAKMVKEGENHHLELNIKSSTLKITMTEDLPNEIKDTFNHLILRLKREYFNFNIGEVGTDLFSQIAEEYIGQLNKELTAIHTELEHYGLLEDTEKEK